MSLGRSVGLSGEDNINWKGGKAKHSEGYVMLRMKNHPHADHHGYVMKHRWIMEKHLGRYLTKKEEVHHKNGSKTDNRIGNLQLILKADHCRLHNPRKIADMEDRICTSCARKTRKIKTRIGNWVYAWYKSGVANQFLCHLCYDKKRRWNK